MALTLIHKYIRFLFITEGELHMFTIYYPTKTSRFFCQFGLGSTHTPIFILALVVYAQQSSRI